MAIHTYNTSWHDTNRGVSLFVSIYVCLYLLVVYLSKQLHHSPKIAQYLPEAGMVLLVGMIAGACMELVLRYATNQMAGDVVESVLAFDSSIFFIVFLPPIIFNSGYHLHRQLLYRYFTPICLLAFCGTMASMVLVASILHVVCSTLLPNFSPTFNELLAFGALISATDPVSTLAVFSAKKVDPQLFYLLSGESLLNDAVGLVLFEAFAHLVERKTVEGDLNVGAQAVQVLVDVLMNFGGSLVLGVLLGLLVAYGLKKIDLRPTPLLELSAYILIMYAPFVLAEICRLSGIVTVLFTGLAARRYAEPNLSKFSAESSDTIFRVVSHVTETLIFLELGLSVITILRNGINVVFVVAALLACLISRALNVYPILLSYNICQRLIYGEQGLTKSLLPNEVTAELTMGGESPTSSDDEGRPGNVPVPVPINVDSAQEVARNDTFIPRNTTHFLFLSGLRGAVSYGLVKTFPDDFGNKVTFEATTMLIVLITTFLFGGMTDYALTKLEIPVGVDEDVYMKSLPQPSPSKMSWWRRFEEKRLCPFVLRDFTPPSSSNEDDFLYQEQEEAVEMTEQSFQEQSATQKRKPPSIYDFGQ